MGFVLVVVVVVMVVRRRGDSRCGGIVLAVRDGQRS